MRKNLPATNHEYFLTETNFIVLKTDLFGNTTYVNDDFLRVSGLSETDLIGSPQNIVRHPDMPTEAFVDFWRTIKSAKAWTGMVKNRCKNGDFYWLEATAAPLVENNEIVGYIAIRVKPRKEDLEAPDAAYKEIRNGNTLIDSARRGNRRRIGAFFFKVFFES